MYDFESFGKIPRYRSQLCITEKIDGTNAQVTIFGATRMDPLGLGIVKDSPFCIHSWKNELDDMTYCMFAGSRKRWIAPEGTPDLEKGCDNYGFAGWVRDNRYDLMSLGAGQHFGEWFGGKIARKYGRAEKEFKLFNAVRWNPNNPNRPNCCNVVDQIDTEDPVEAMMELKENGSLIITDDGIRFPRPEGIIIYHPGIKSYFKQTFDFDKGKWSA